MKTTKTDLAGLAGFAGLIRQAGALAPQHSMQNLTSSQQPTIHHEGQTWRKQCRRTTWNTTKLELLGIRRRRILGGCVAEGSLGCILFTSGKIYYLSLDEPWRPRALH